MVGVAVWVAGGGTVGVTSNATTSFREQALKESRRAILQTIRFISAYFITKTSEVIPLSVLVSMTWYGQIIPVHIALRCCAGYHPAARGRSHIFIGYIRIELSPQLGGR